MNLADRFLRPDPAWRIGSNALLVLDALRDGERTVLYPRERRTPYQWQPYHYQDRDDQPFVLLHNSSGGFVEGDQAALQIRAAAGTRFLLSGTGATKFFKCPGGETSADAIDIELAPECLLEYLPDETIPFAKSRSDRRFSVVAETSARLFLSDVLVAGRLHYGRGERFAFDALASETRVVIGGRLQWLDRLRLQSRAQVRDLEALWGGYLVMGTVVWYAPALPESLADEVAAYCEGLTQVAAAVSRPGLVTCMRLFGQEAWVVREAILGAWALVRPHLAAKPARDIRKP